MFNGHKKACFERSPFFKVNDPARLVPTQINELAPQNGKERNGKVVHTIPADRLLSLPKSNYELFNRSNFSIR